MYTFPSMAALPITGCTPNGPYKRKKAAGKTLHRLKCDGLHTPYKIEQ